MGPGFNTLDTFDIKNLATLIKAPSNGSGDDG
jgi:cephalosporin-C deacetylase-like acetyl esterase